MFVVYDSSIQIFSGNPSQGLSEPAFMDLLGSIPTGCDETIIPEAKVGEYIVTARMKGHDWYIGGLTDWTVRDINVKLDFVEGGDYTATLCKDGVNAEKYATDYNIITRNVNK